MDESNNIPGRSTGVSSGPLRLHRQDGSCFVVGFGLWIPVESEQEGLDLITELENQGYRLCC